MKRVGEKWILASLCGVLAGTCVAFLGCELSSADSVTRNVGIDFTGYYDKIDGDDNPDFVNPANSGSRVTSFNLIQSGDQLQAIDNNGRVFNGSIGSVSDTTASFTLQGSTTAGNAVDITGTLSGDAASETATMRGTWIESSLYATVYGDAQINPIATNTPDTNTTALAVSANPSTVTADGGQSTLTATGGSGTYSAWSVEPSGSGSFSANSGSPVTFQAGSTTGSVTITVKDSTNGLASVTVTITN